MPTDEILGNVNAPSVDGASGDTPQTETRIIGGTLLTQQPEGLTLPSNYEELVRVEARKTAESIVQGDKASLINVFGIFASIVAFISIEIQVLKQICDFWRLLGFSAFILAGLLSFMFILQYIMKSWMENDRGVAISTICTWNYWKELKMNFSLILAFLMVSFLFCYSYIAMEKADSEYLCKDLQIQQKFNETKDRLEGMELERYKKLDDKIILQQKQIDALIIKKE